MIGNDIKLSCQSAEGSPAPQYTWKSYDSQYLERSLPSPGEAQQGRRARAKCVDWLGLPGVGALANHIPFPHAARARPLSLVTPSGAAGEKE